MLQRVNASPVDEEPARAELPTAPEAEPKDTVSSTSERDA